MTVLDVLVELCEEQELIVGKSRREKRREEGRGGGGCLVSDGVPMHLSSDGQRERMDEFVAIGAVVPQESVPSIALRDATYAIGQVADLQRVSPQATCGSASASAQACACLSPAATRSFVIVQPFNQPELSRVPHGQFFSNCREHNITFDFEGKCGVLFQLAGHLIAGVVGFVACERSVELAARTAARALETVAVQMLHCAFASALSHEDKKNDEKAGAWRERGCGKRDCAGEAGWAWGWACEKRARERRLGKDWS
ncbi:uncharacterized protein MONOS_13853 [Monocercomonoides exilis]|uniref:uncharacterized protein n=1 Tax=Monocercomonoides exilis TaxID=2049356 RepID=UPI003559B123|nr:hypothetical protein MONOS_13853 [Monocercomonoides exilis]|eukprot:MONOS_13853.1-p1 / transcript=MONOS_13853.1 / gene=MONOS_13853 / organism=Monocercomonoides_exilis_PA203 / gene_product=unspecified product / transcript_product=unspecified product / location=Mono_scaffold00894:5581-6692(+) / protein_length=256 / sequence_SO=supercontig / SO=protein_coding / is_pseudo=false